MLRATCAPFWFALDGWLDESNGTVVGTDESGRQVLESVGEVDPAAPYVGVVHTGSVLPVARFHEESMTVAVRLPAGSTSLENSSRPG